MGKELIDMMKSYLDGKIDANEFSFDFPARLAYVTPELDKENSKLSNLLNEDMPEICGNFEPEEAFRTLPEYLDEKEFRKRVKEIYDKAIELL